jgi:predicted permease
VSRARSFLRNLFRGARADRDLDAELQAYLSFGIEEHLRKGLTREEARRQARLDMGGVEQVKESVRDVRAGARLEGILRDLLHALRVLRKDPGFASAAILTIALGVGVNAAVFSIVNGLAFRRLALPDSGRLVSLTQKFDGRLRRNVHGMDSFFSYPEYRAYRDLNHSLSGLMAYEPFVTAALSGREPREVIGVLTTCNYFEVLGVHPSLGRSFTRDECSAPGAAAVVVIGDDLWRSVFGGDPSLIGRTVSLNRVALTVIGIAPRGFRGTEAVAASFWAPITMQPSLQAGRGFLADDHLSWLALIGRLAPGAPLSAARADLRVIAGQLDRLEPTRRTELRVEVATILPQPEEQLLVLGVGGLLLAAVALVLLVACANVANLLLVRGVGRRREMAVRLAIGAGRARLVRQLLAESVVIAAIGGTIGVVLAAWSSDALVAALLAHLPADVPELTIPVGTDLRLVAYAAGLTLLTAVAFGLLPALTTSRIDLVAALKQRESPDDRRAGAGVWRQGLVSVQVAVSMVLLLSAGLLARALVRTYNVDPGFTTANVSVLSFDLENAGYTRARAVEFNRRLLERLSSLPGVTRVALARTTPLSDQHVEMGFSTSRERPERSTELNFVSPSYFEIFGIRLVRGRLFSQAEQDTDARVAIVTEAAARCFWPDRDPLGRPLWSEGGSVPYQVIGVVRDAQVSHLGERAPVYLYLPAGSESQMRTDVVVQFSGRLGPIAGPARAAARGVDADLPVTVRQVGDNLELWRVPSRLAAAAAGTLGGLALVLAMLGLYGVVAYGVSRRVREIGIRVALGAGGRDVMRSVLARAIAPVVIGCVAGVAVAAGAARLLSALLYGVSPLDPLAFVGVPCLLLAAALAASYLPARRALRVDPVTALRYE